MPLDLHRTHAESESPQAIPALPAAAEIIGIESFNNPNGALAGKNGGTFWTYQNTPTAGRSNTGSTWINLNGTPSVTSGQLVTSGNGAVRRAYNGNTEATGEISDANVAKTVFYKVNVTTGPSFSAGDYFGISSMEGGAEHFYFGKRGVGANWGAEQVGVGGTIDATALADGMTISGNSTSRHFEVLDGSSLTLRGLNFIGRNSASSSGGITSSGTLTLSRCTLSGNTSDNGGAILAAGTIIAEDCTFSDNTATDRAGGVLISSNGSTATSTRCTARSP